MEKVKDIGGKLYRHSLVRYCVIGGGTFTMDFVLLIFFHELLNIPVLVAATASYWIAIAFNFTANRFWSFGATTTAVTKHAVPYLALLGFNYLFTIGFVAGATHLGMHYTIAKIVALAIQISWTYIAYKKFIFK